MAMSREGTALQREAANRLREFKMKTSRNVSAPKTMTQPPPPFTIASIAPTLAVLKALPMRQQAMLLLRRLVQIYPTVRNADKFKKQHILLPKDNWQIALGYPDSENMPVRQHLMGGPWNRLVVDGYLVDPGGQGFHDISPEGFAAAEAAAKPKPAPVPQQPPQPEKIAEFEEPGRPVVFVSYSWDTPEHEKWVLDLATRLHEHGGVNVILDKWHLRMGMPVPFFMEKAIAESDFVLIVCTPTYAKKANERYGGVGYEATIITAELAEDILDTKFIPVLREGAWNKISLPRWLAGRKGPDLRGDPYSDEQYNLLVMELHGLYPKPPAPGPKPHFSFSPAPTTSAAAASAVQPVQAGRLQNAIAYAFYETKGPDAKFFKMYIRPLDSGHAIFRLDTSDGEVEEGILNDIVQDFILTDREYIQNDYVCTHYSNSSGRKDLDLH